MNLVESGRDDGRRRRRAITLVEVILATLVVGVMMAGALATVSASQRTTKTQGDGMLARQLAQDLLDEIMAQGYSDAADSSASNGPTAAELLPGNRSLFNDVNDYKGWSETPAKDRSGVAIAGTTGLSRTVAVEFLTPTNLSLVSATDQGTARITVSVKRQGGTLATVVGVRTSGLPATQACKLANGTCADLVPSRCTTLGGTSQGVGTTCWTLKDRALPTAVALWMFDETSGTAAVDSSSLGTHAGTLVNGPTWGTGRIGGAIVMDGTNDYVTVSNHSSLNLGTAVTASAWVNSTNLTNYRTVLHKGTATNRRNYFLQTFGTQVTFGFYSTSGALQRFTTIGATILPAAWHHLAATFDDATDTVVIYVNGAAAGTWTTTTSMATNNQALEIGRSPYGDYWQGRLDDVRVYDRALTASDVTMLYQGGEP